ncbi:MAG: hypothetical protein D6B27_03550 [Gammaproteobacteria bacterium]|nr:MAG: hypothetical protein D6B27_03550 [Gammaproteobacteria bacterium]
MTTTCISGLLALAFIIMPFTLKAEERVFSAQSDEFNSPANLENWSIINKEQLKTLKIEGGKLILEPSKKPSRIAWYQDDQGPFVYKNIKGNFIVEVKLKIGSIKDANETPTSQFNSAGIVVRDPRSKDGKQNWVMYNIGSQYMEFGREAKTTENSSSSLNIYATSRDNSSGKLRICRIGKKLYLYHWLTTESKWHPESAYEEFHRNDFQDELQVGMIINASGRPRETHAEFDYIKFFNVKDKSGCLAE